jgi:hypothetical protein
MIVWRGKKLFELPTETKQKYEIPGIGGQRVM